MYRRKPQGWMKHIDFILLDILSLFIAFFLAFVSRHGFHAFYFMEHYLNIFSIYTLIVVLLHIVNNTFSNVLKRGYYKEFAHTVKHVLTVELAITFYLFSIKQS